MTNIHSAVPKKNTSEVPIELLESITIFVHRFAYGSENSKTAKQISNALGLIDSAQDNLIRKAVKILFNDCGVPIISNSKGFFFASNRAEMKKFIDNQEKRRMGLERNINSALGYLPSLPEVRKEP